MSDTLFSHLSGSLGLPASTPMARTMDSLEAMMAKIPKPDPMAFNGRMFVDRYLCESPRFIRWKRKHRKARINKKWRKRHGAVYETCKGVAFNVLGNLHVCPCMARLMEALK